MPTCNGRQFDRACGQNFKAAACIICEDSTGRFLITRRQKQKKSFPSAWVYPGGNIEVGEGLDEGSLREFYEETGVKI